MGKCLENTFSCVLGNVDPEKPHLFFEPQVETAVALAVLKGKRLWVVLLGYEQFEVHFGEELGYGRLLFVLILLGSEVLFGQGTANGQ